MSSVQSLSDRSTLKHIGIGITLFVGGGLASYAVIHYFSLHKQPSPLQQNGNSLSKEIGNLKQEIGVLKGTLTSAVNDLRRELDSIKGAIKGRSSGRTSRTRSRSAGTTGSFATAWSEEDYDLSDDEFDLPPDHLEGELTTGEPSLLDTLMTICSRVDELDKGSDEDKEESMRILQDNELKFENSWEFLWRLCRSHVGAYDVREAHDEKCLHAMSALEYARHALELKEDSCDVHKWYAISLGASTDFVGTKEKIEYGYELKEHIDRALELDGSDATLHFMKGRWCWGVYMLTWIERKLAATLFATPPTATVQDALHAFKKAEEIDPGFYKSNQYYIAKCYYEQSDYNNAKTWLESALLLPCNNKDDRDAQESIEKLLNKL